MRYKVGDKVKVRNGLEVNKHYGMFSFVDEMKQFENKILTIKKST